MAPATWLTPQQPLLLIEALDFATWDRYSLDRAMLRFATFNMAIFYCMARWRTRTKGLGNRK